MQRFCALIVAILGIVLPSCTSDPSPRRESPARGARPAERYQPLERQRPVEIRTEHPRLFLSNADLTIVKQAIERDRDTKQLYDAILKNARDYLKEPTPQYSRSQPELLTAARRILARVTTLALIYRLTGEKDFAEQARRDMLVAARFPDWMPDNFLPTAELSNAMGIGYDWLYDYLGETDRDAIRRAIIDKSLKPAMKYYQSDTGWARAEMNHNNVCNGGVLVGALAIAETEPELAQRIVRESRQSIATAMKLYAPDGGWPEGPMYWNYATRYTCYYLAALESATGDDLGLKDTPGFAHTGFFGIHSTGPTRLTFNFGDGDAQIHPAPFMFYLARTLKQPVFAAYERWAGAELETGMELVWAPLEPTPSFEELANQPLNRDAIFRGVHCAFFRGSWTDPNTTYLAFKGGQNIERGTHQHLDLGSFIMDALGQRWACDLGPDDYELPGYTREQRWSYYRCSTPGHNTITLDDGNQDTSGKAPLVAFHSETDRAFAVADMSDAYDEAKGGRMYRGVMLIDRKHVLVQDEIDLRRGARITWNFHTPAKVRLDGSSALLQQNGRTLHAHILSPSGARFAVEPGDPNAHKDPQDVRNLIIRLPRDNGAQRIAVLLSPGDEEPPRVRLQPLSEWIKLARE
jgi:hypothetical protein